LGEFVPQTRGASGKRIALCLIAKWGITDFNYSTIQFISAIWCNTPILIWFTCLKISDMRFFVNPCTIRNAAWRVRISIQLRPETSFAITNHNSGG